jgi:hypothetical protein
VYGDTAYVVLHGKRNTLIQYWWENCKEMKAVVDVDKLFKKHKKGDTVKIEKGRWL